MASSSTKVRIRIPQALTLGVMASVVLMLASFSGGATRNRGGLLEVLNVGFLAYGHGRNLGMVAYWVGLFGLVAAWILAGRQVLAPHLKSSSPKDDESFRRIRTMMWAWVLPLLLAAPLASRDVYSYLMQGAMVRDGFDPYTEGAAVNPGPFLLEVSHDWRNTTTPYGPLHLWMGEGVTRLVGDSVAAGIITYKLISVLGFAIIAWAIPKIARALGGDPTLALWLGVANPVVVLHLVGGMHNESVMVALVSLALLAALHRRFQVGFVLVGIAVALKATAIFAMPFIVWLMVLHYAPQQRGRIRQCIAFVVSGIIAVVEIAATVALITWVSGSSWGWLSQISGNSKVVNPLAGPTLAADIVVPLVQVFSPDATYNAILSVLRNASMVVMLLCLAVVWCLSRRSARRAIAGTAAAYQAAFLFNSVTLPWYYASVLTLMGTFRPPLWLVKFTTGATVFIGLSFAGDGNHQMYNWWWDIGLIIGAWFMTQWVFAGVAPSSGEETPLGQAVDKENDGVTEKSTPVGGAQS
ncbi:alpha-(1-_6)-mannopyranosyltransferase A [Corynebacterium flavescens]|uniref:alpha-(1->6)-mannopyranosyltransferase A n=1 Tax=Corynebacterium flavescens TaxID=28028 RepID=UPI0026477896|nr:alpha-(1->6)-mannopyranosyltransferase A [Corynebacterium flavescens]MDN6431311.1 alpha-(1->6)-mannopyranosyltransferase A [Corynebacterium flavescens]MDN6475472.1 alpha-(1->6)-mannopyranosyltransferase A [Corynebacterium flavescens]MDN6531188.1 alpha-(1->6)-mannopyranosyltransferase A [Corynebacterium flavescens]MDN6600541.1 alpha-(1->6)-mannopyranosyltransferase A [Corynebacterium flavescens]MDN6687373.1 alpha-(1->6)-mannopyranosyltransferase A [Corynebacterium flavescens]